MDDEGQLPIEGIFDLFADNSYPSVTAPDSSGSLTSEPSDQKTEDNVRVSSRGRRVKPNPRFNDYVMDE